MNIEYMIAYFYSKKYMRFVVKHYIKRKEGGEFFSKILRNIFKNKYDSNIGLYSYGCFEPEFNFGEPFDVGRYCSIAQGVKCIPGNHPIKDISTHPFFHRKELGYFNEKGPRKIERLCIGHDVWIGMNALIMPGCKNIGNGAVIGGGSVVTHDIPPYAVVCGNPARVIKYRFSEEEIKMLEESRWWNLEPKELKSIIHEDVDLFVKNVGKYREYEK